MLGVLLSAFVVVTSMGGGVFAQTPAPRAEPRTEKAAAVVNLNTATATELESLPGIGATVAARIIDYRQKKGPFKKIEELMNIQGIGERSFLRLRPQLTVAAKADAGQN